MTLLDISFNRENARRAWSGLKYSCQELALWWVRECSELLPAPVLALFMSKNSQSVYVRFQRDGIIIVVATPQKRVLLQKSILLQDCVRGALESALLSGGIALSPTSLVLQLPADCFFRRTMTMPHRARGKIATITKDELEHQTPFAIEDVYLASTIDRSSSSKDTIRVEQTIIKRSLVEEAAERIKIPVSTIAFVMPEGEPDVDSAVPLRHASVAETQGRARFIKLMVASTAIVALSAAVLIWWKRETVIASMEAELATVNRKVEIVQKAANTLAQTRASLQALRQRRTLPSAIDALRETSRLLPDDTWVTEWRLQNDTFSMAGLSESAARLVGVFEGSPFFKEPNLNSPISFDAVTGKERFSLVARVRSFKSQSGG
jgi:general secretion pathway protein L